MVNPWQKEENRFKFIPFSQRISNINVDVFHRVSHRNEESETERKTFFQEAVEKWTVLNRTKEWMEFCKLVVAGGVMTLPQLLNQKDTVAKLFCDHLLLQTEHSLQPVLECLVAFVKDLRQEFYQYYRDILQQLIKLLNSKIPENIEQTFVCLAYIFKYLVRNLVKDLDIVLVDLAPLLDDSVATYIREFAAESFAFVARRVKDKLKLLTLILATAQKHQNIIAGCGRLVMETMYGIKGQHHSSAEEMLKTIFRSFGASDLPQHLLFSLTRHIVEAYVVRILPQHSIISRVIAETLKEKMLNPNPSVLERSISPILNILLMVLEHGGGIHLTSIKITAEVVISICLLPHCSKSVKDQLAPLVTKLLNAPCVKLPQDYAVRLLSLMLKQPKEILLEFVESVCDYGGFEAIILPSLLDHQELSEAAIITTLAKVVAKKMSAKTEWSLYPLKFKDPKVPSTLLSTVTDVTTISQMEEISCCVFLIPHVHSLDIEKAVELLSNLAKKLAENVSVNDERQAGSLFLIYLALESLTHLEMPEIFCGKEIYDNVLPLASESFIAFKILQLLLTLMVPHGVKIEDFSKIRKAAILHLSSPYHQIRATSLVVLQNLERLEGSQDSELLSVLDVCLNAEKVTLTVQTYREATVYIRELHHERVGINENLMEIPFRFLLGYLHSNFALVEADVIEAIRSYDKSTSVWEVLKEQLTHKIKNIGGLPDLDAPKYLKNWVESQIGCDDKTSDQSFKDRLWKTLQNFSLEENHEKDIIDITIQCSQSKELSQFWDHTCDIQHRSDAAGVADDADDIDESSELPPNQRLNKKILVYQLDIISKTKSHCTYKYKMAEMKKLCMELLLDGDCSVRKSALQCLVAQTPKSLTPYRKNLLDLIDDDGFKAAIVHFQLNKEAGEVKEGHRSMVMPIVLRLLYSKMVSSAPIQRGNKSSAAALRRKQVMRFLSGCLEKEMQDFLVMSFSIFNLDPTGRTPSSEIVERSSQVTLTKMIHPRKLMSIINLASVVLEHLGGHLAVQLQKFLLQVLLSVAATVTGALAQRENILSGFLPSLKKLRAMSLVTLSTFFDKFHRFPWMEEDIQAIFQAMVWPQAEKMALAGFHSPTPLLKLFSVWSRHPRYFVLLARHMEGDESETPLKFIVKLLLNEQCQLPVTTEIVAILERLLTLREDIPMETDEPSTPPLEIKYVRPIETETLAKLTLKEELNYGSQLLLPHVGEILEMLRRQLARNERRGLNRAETVVLARVTECATSPEHADALIGLMLRLLSGKPSGDEEVLVNSLLTIKNLLTIVSKPLNYLRNLSVLFGNIELVQGRKVLISCLEDLSVRCPELADLMTIARDLNAYDRRWVDQCDFNKRLDTLRLVRTLAAENKLSLNVATFVLHIAFFFLRTEKDLSIRDSTELCLKEICPKLLETVQENVGEREFLTETLLKAILGGVQGKDDRFKASVISLLGVLARESPASHFVFKDLSLFANAADLEVDFFENIHHLQLYRRNRALLKLASVLKTLVNPISMRTLTQFLMPLCSQFLCNETYAGKNSLVDAAIECVGTLCRLLPWYQYQSILKHYLLKLTTQLEYQRQCVRLVIAILDAFHFDISRAKEHLEKSQLDDVQKGQDQLAPGEPMDEGKEQLSDTIKEENEEVADVVHSILDAVVAENNEDETLHDEPDDAMQVGESSLLVENIVVLKPAAAMRVLRAISGHLLEQLNKAIGQRTAVENSHKLNRKNLGPDKDEEDILRIPIAVTLVKLLQKLPGNLLETQLQGIFMKLCTFLKSHLESVRRLTRETLQQIMVSVGPSRLPLLLGELTTLLTKGFQCHVLAFTINSVIQSLTPFLQAGDIDASLPTILQVCSADLFGLSSEEKEVVRIQVKYKEVRSNKSFNLLHLVAQYITDKCLTDLILPIKQALSMKNSHKIMVKCRECLRQIVLGLAMNKFIPAESMFVFLYGAASESIPQLKPTLPPMPKKYNPKERQDCFLLVPEPKSRSASAPVKNNVRSGAHIIIEFGLHLLMLLLKQDKIKKMNLGPFLNPLVPILRSALESQHVQVSMLAVKCLTRMANIDLPSLRENIKSITACLFTILHKFAVAGLSKGDNFDLVLAVFKMVSVIVRDVEYHTLTQDQLHALLLYAEQDIHDNSRQAVAFGLIKSILHRRLNTPELHNVLEKVASLSVTSDMMHVRAQARQTMLQYIMDYPLGKKLDDLLGFFIAQLDYGLESGRLSALEMIFSLINSFPMSVLKNKSGLLFLTLGARLVNDESPECKKLVAAVIKGMLLKLNSNDRDELFDILLVWLKQKKLIHRRLAIQLAGIFVTLEKEEFERRLSGLLPLIQNQLTGNKKPGQFVKQAVATEDEESLLDHHLYLILVLLVKLCVHCPALLNGDQHMEKISTLVDTAQSLLCHEHEWVRVGAAQFLGAVFSAVKPNKMAAALNGETGDIADVKFWDSASLPAKVRSLVLDHTAQFVPGVELSQDFVDQLMKNLVYFAKVLKDVTPVKSDTEEEEGKKSNGWKNDSNQQPTLPWLLRRMRKIVNIEVARTPGTHTLRSAVFLWIGAVAVCLTKEELLPLLYNLAAPLVREAEVAQGEATQSAIAVLAADVAAKLKKKVGVDDYSECAVKLQAKLLEKRAKRKTAKAQEFVVDPERAVKRKIERQVKKKENKKRKLEIVSGKKRKFKGKKR